ncbi:hypothetical protein CKO25_09670 [Thiocapsa imhoffii]|uniref:OmpA-like domain-containing protein n=1 Tax=Thiocapsa imhoffii TaxID=382777 RepID=A0A9X1B947_9GAMM|nr:OmpA family protein [Thiocapsa imhoffii]MBK1644913.1 hypothetical protein [Thiocapsa imhoffii]
MSTSKPSARSIPIGILILGLIAVAAGFFFIIRPAMGPTLLVEEAPDTARDLIAPIASEAAQPLAPSAPSPMMPRAAVPDPAVPANETPDPAPSAVLETPRDSAAMPSGEDLLAPSASPPVSEPEREPDVAPSMDAFSRPESRDRRDDDSGGPATGSLASPLPPASAAGDQTATTEQVPEALEQSTSAVVMEMDPTEAGTDAAASSRRVTVEPAPPADSEPEPEVDAAQRMALVERVEHLEMALAALYAHQSDLEAQLSAQLERIHAAVSDQGMPLAPAVAPVRFDRAGLDAALDELGGDWTPDGYRLLFEEAELGFAVGESEPADPPLTTIAALADLLMRYDQLWVRIEGHTDPKGGTARNLALSQDRAEAVRELLIESGVEASRMTAVGLANARPITDNRTVAARERNRRVEIYLIEPETEDRD